MMACLRGVGAFSFALATILMGCSGQRPDIESLPLPDVITLQKKLSTNRVALKDFKGLGIVEVYGPETKLAMGVRIFFLVPDYLKVSWRGVMGIDIGTLVLADDRYYLENSASPVPMSGRVDELKLPDYFDMSIGKDELLDLFLPLTGGLQLPESANLQIDREAQCFLVVWSDSSTLRKLWADPFRPVVSKELALSTSGDTIQYKELGEAKKRSNVFMPLSWRVQLGSGAEAYQMRLKLSSLWVNTGLTRGDFGLGAHAEEDSVENSLGE